MKKLLTFITIVSLSSMALFAQRANRTQIKRDPVKVANMRTNKMAQELQLSPVQKKRVHEIFLKSSRRSAAYNTDKRDELKQIRQKENIQLSRVLTTSQMQQYRDMQNAKRQNRINARANQVHRGNLKTAPINK